MSDNLFPVGKYIAKVTDADIREAQTGTRQACLSFEVIEGEHANKTPPNYYGPLTDKSLQYSVKSLRSAGWKGDDLTDLSSCIGNTVQIVVVHDAWDGKTRDKVKFVNKPGMGGKIMTSEEKSEFAENMRAQIAALSAGSTADTDVPFEV